ncbi:MAG: enhanced serine sensitivity protein SseB [Lachnospiraceae bacterium]|nr:enhanced serine sensitivity protein SseB [Ruminococcus sp.]MCM1275283.1 enhanced serine sensitivity protein SseB [Lachnospiraceae bacterium]
MANNLYINQKLENPAMRELLARRRSVDPSDKTAVSEVMSSLINEIVMNARFLTAARFSSEPFVDTDGSLALPQKTDLTFTMITNSNDEHFLPVFSETPEMDKWKDADIEHTIQIGFDSIAPILLSGNNYGGFVINPFSDNMTISREITLKWLEKKQMMLHGHAQHVISPDSKYEFHSLKPYPMLLSNKLCETARSISVNKLWLRGITLDGTDGYLLVVDFTGDRMETFTALGNSARPFLSDKPLHMIDCRETFGQIAVENNIPIYSKD